MPVNDRPLTVTVAITTYNQAAFISQTIDTVLAQTRPADEIVVVDDGSLDDTPSILARYVPKVRIIRQQNSGVARARNRAVAEATCKYVAFLDGDDLWHPSKLERSLAAAETDLSAPVVVHDIDTVSGDGLQVIRHAPLQRFFERLGSRSVASMDSWDALVEKNFVWTTSQVLVQRDAYVKAGESNPKFLIASDYDLYLRLSRAGPFLLVFDVLASWRQHNSTSGAGTDRICNWAIDCVLVLRHRANHETDQRRQLRQSADNELRHIRRHLYLQEHSEGSWQTALRLARIAVACRDVRSGLLGAAICIPQGVRHVGAMVSRIRMT